MADARRLSVEAALAMIEQSVRPARQTREIDIGPAAVGQVTAVPVVAASDFPRFDMSAMDGFAMRSADASAASPGRPALLALAAPLRAVDCPQPLQPGQAVPISTGAMIPAGADTVLIREKATVVGGRLSVPAPPAAGLNIRRRGEDVALGSEILPIGTQLTPDSIGMLASAGVRRVVVRHRPTIALISTGSELAVADPAHGSAGFIDSNRPMLEAACANAGLACNFLRTVADDRGDIQRLFDALVDPAAGDIVITTGGISAGDFDLVRPGLERAGAQILFHGIAMRPGKPLLFAILPDGRLFFGLPGNPVSALIGFRFFVLAAVRRMLGLAREIGLPAATDLISRDDVTQFLRVRRTETGWSTDGLDQRSHVLSSVVRADGWLRIERAANGETSSTVYAKVPVLA